MINTQTRNISNTKKRNTGKINIGASTKFNQQKEIVRNEIADVLDKKVKSRGIFNQFSLVLEQVVLIYNRRLSVVLI